MRIRPAEISDLERLVEIYNHYVCKTHITFHTEAFTLATRQSWFAQFAASGPHRLLVAEEDQGVIGYASSSEFKAREAYRSSVETTIYVHHEHTGLGIGSALYGQLLTELQQEASTHRAYGGVALPNDASVELHLRLGFKQVALFNEVGFKFGRYWDVAWFEKHLD